MTRKLVTIREVGKKYPIENADRIEIIQVDGWQCVAKKNEFKEGDLCIYFEIDSFLPKEDRYSFLGSTKQHQGKDGYRIKTIKLRGQLSQGLALPISLFPEINNEELMYSNDDFAARLNVIKYDNEINMNGSISSNTKTKSSFPSFLKKTDQERIQNLTKYFDMYKDMEFEETLKLDGSSMTVYKKSIKLKWYKSLINKIYPFFGTEEFGVCSRNLNLQESKGNAFWDIANKLKLKEILPVGYAIQGELIGPKIQSNHEKVKENQFYAFDIYNIKEQRYLSPNERHYMMSGSLQNINHVPVKNISFKIFNECSDLNSLLSRVEGLSMNQNTISEGRVYKSMTNPEITFKCISNKYLLKEN